MPADLPPVFPPQRGRRPIPTTRDPLDGARRFYGATLGLEERPRPPVFPGTGIWYAVGDQELHLFSEPTGVTVNPQSRRHPCFQVDDVSALRAHLTATGVTTRDHDGEIPGRPRFF